MIAPTFRHGKFIRKSQGLDNVSIKDALSIAETINASLDKYSQGMICELRNHVGDHSRFRDIKITKAQVTGRYAPGIIIDFPTFEITTKAFKLEARLCLTVCLEDNSSKVWCRIRLLDWPGSTDLTLEQIKAFYDYCEVISEHSLKLLIRNYQEDFQEGTKSETILAEDGNVRIFTIDIDGVNAHDFEVTSAKINLNPEEKILTGTVAHAFTMLSEILPENSYITSSSDNFEISKTVSYFTEEALNRSPAIFLGYEKGSDVEFYGIAPSDEGEVPHWSNAMVASRNLAIDYASHR